MVASLFFSATTLFCLSERKDNQIAKMMTTPVHARNLKTMILVRLPILRGMQGQMAYTSIERFFTHFGQLKSERACGSFIAYFFYILSFHVGCP